MGLTKYELCSLADWIVTQCFRLEDEEGYIENDEQYEHAEEAYRIVSSRIA